MKSVSTGEIDFNLAEEKAYLEQVISILNRKYKKHIFRPKGKFALHFYDSLAYVIPKIFPKIEGNENNIYSKIDALRNDEKYQNISTNTFSNKRIKDRMDRALEVFASA